MLVSGCSGAGGATGRVSRIPPPPAGDIEVLRDFFADDRNMWGEHKGADFDAAVRDGRFALVIKRSGSQVIAYPDILDAQAPRLQDVVVAVEGDVLAGEGSFGVWCRSGGERVPGSIGLIYVMSVSTQGLAQVRKLTDEGAEELASARLSNRREGAVRGECSGEREGIVRLALYADGPLILEAIDSSGYGPGRVGLFAESSMVGAPFSVTFDNFAVSR